MADQDTRISNVWELVDPNRVIFSSDGTKILGPVHVVTPGALVSVVGDDHGEGAPLTQLLVDEIVDERVFGRTVIRRATFVDPSRFPWIIPLTVINDAQKRALVAAYADGQGRLPGGLSERESADLERHGLAQRFGPAGGPWSYVLTAAGNSGALQLRDEWADPDAVRG